VLDEVLASQFPHGDVSFLVSKAEPIRCRILAQICGGGIMIDYGRLRTDLLALTVLAMAVFLGLSLVSYDPADAPAHIFYPIHAQPMNLCGAAGAQLAHSLMVAVGAGAYFILIGLIVFDIRLFVRDVYKDPITRSCGAVLILSAACVAAHWYFPIRLNGSMAGNGGYLGAWGAILLDQHFSRVGSLVLLSTAAIAGLLLTGEQQLVRMAFGLLVLPITMWSRLAFGRRVVQRPKATTTTNAVATPATTNPVTARAATPAPLDPLPEKTPEVHEETDKIENPVDDPALVPDAPVSTIRINAPPNLSPSALAAIVSMINPPSEADDVDHAVTTAPTLDEKPAKTRVESRRLTYDEDDEDAVETTTFSLSPGRSPIRVNPPSGMGAQPSGLRSVLSSLFRAPHPLPETSILDDAEAFPYGLLAAKAQIAAATLEKTFQEFGLNVKVVEIDTGPVITQFELELEKGLRLSKVTSLADDLAIALRVSSVRVIAPIPGKNTVGVEVPNDVRVMVRLKELIDSCRADIDSKGIPMFLGKDASGKPLVVDMCKMPHLLIAGRTGTGKSVCLNTLIVSMLMTRSPDQVKMLMIDPKMVELSPYSRIPHLMHPVITDMKKAEAVLGWAVEKMEERYQLLSAVGVRHIDSYNKLGREKILAKLGLEPGTDEAETVPESIPYIVIIADEMADMMMTSGKDVEGHIIRLAQKSRAVGIHLVLATQKPTVDVITGLIKSNLPARISFQVASRMDSRVVLDEMGADKLLGKGDMLYMAPETSALQRAQGTYVSDDEVNKVIEFFADQEPQYDEELVRLKAAAPSSKGSKGGGSSEARERDDVYDEAVAVVIREGRGSVSLLQRALGVGYGRGARLIDWMAEDGVVGGYNGSQAREVIMSLDEWDEVKESRDLAVGRK
jgi:S-DNA-T family DNA segregation ATPase FtsK/SpoIIIE